jgi:Uma2 family endonuclease
MIETQRPLILATNVTLEEYMERYAEQGCEWVEGTVYKLAPIELRHEEIRDYLRSLIQAYFALKPIGRVLGEPFVMRLPAFPKRRREPDLMVILKANGHAELKDTYLDGPANICIEIVSPGSVVTDHGEKLEEYELGGVAEYWIIDPTHNECRFHRLNEQQKYEAVSEDQNGIYTTPQLPQLELHVPTLWREVLPGFYDVGDAVRAMLSNNDNQ